MLQPGGTPTPADDAGEEDATQLPFTSAGRNEDAPVDAVIAGDDTSALVRARAATREHDDDRSIAFDAD